MVWAALIGAGVKAGAKLVKKQKEKKAKKKAEKIAVEQRKAVEAQQLQQALVAQDARRKSTMKNVAIIGGGALVGALLLAQIVRKK